MLHKLKYFFWFSIKLYVAWTLFSFLLELLDMAKLNKVKDVLVGLRSAPINTLKNLNVILSQ